MTRTRRVAIVATTALALVAGAGCGSDDAKTPVRTPVAETATTPRTSTATARPRSPAPARSDAAIEASQRFFLAIDDDALALDSAIKRAIDDNPDALPAIKRIRARIADRDYDRVVAGGAVSPGVEALKAAAASAQTRAESGDLRQLVLARVAAQDARQQVAGEFVKP